MNGASHETIPDWMRARILTFKRAMPDRVILRAIKQEEILSIALAVHKARAEGGPIPEIQDGVLRDRAAALGHWLDLKLKTDDVPKDKEHNRRFSREISNDLRAIEKDQRIRDALGLPVTAGLRDIDGALAAMPRDDRLRFLNQVEDGSAIATRADTFAIATALRGQAKNITAPQPKNSYANGREARAFDIVEGFIDYAENPRNPFMAQVVRVLPTPGLAEIAIIRRPAAMARRTPYFLLQNLAASAVERDIRPLEDLSLRYRASRPVAKYLKAALGS